MDFIATYKCAETFSDKVKCWIAKLLGAKVVTPLGRIVLLPKDYIKKATETKNIHIVEDT